MTVMAPATWWRGLGGLTRSGSAPEALAWALYDFANTIFSFAIVSFAMGPWAVRFLGEGTGTLLFTVAASASVALNALVSPVLGAQSDRTGGRKGYLLVFTVACVVPTAFIGFVDIGLGLLLFAIALLALGSGAVAWLGSVVWWMVTGRGRGGSLMAAGAVAPRPYRFGSGSGTAR